MAMSVTGMRRPGSMIACRRASRVSALGRTSCAASAGSPAGIASHQNTYSRAPTPATGVSTTNAQPHQADRHVEVRGEPERDATDDPPARGSAQRQPAGRGDGRGGVHGPIVTCPEPFRGRVRGRFRGAAHQVQGAVRGPPDAARSARRVRIETWTRALPPALPDPTRHRAAPRRTSPPTPTGRGTRRTASSPLCAVSASRGPTTAGSAASAGASATGSASTRSWCAASSSRRCCSAGSGSSRTASPGRCCPSAATVASTSRR